MLSWFALTIKRGLKIVKLITKLLLALTMLVSTSAAQASFENYIEPFDETSSVCGDLVWWTGFIKFFARGTENTNFLNLSINVVASGIGESGDIYSLTGSEKQNVKVTDNQFFDSGTLRIKVRNFDTGERYWATINYRFAANVGADLVLAWESVDIDACLFD